MNMRSHYTNAVIVLAIVLAAGIGRTVLTAQAKKTVWNGVYTSEQATRGKAAAAVKCGACHAPTLLGGDLAPSLVGSDFIGHWYDAKLSELVDKVVDTMPADAPGTLKPDEGADIVAFMLELNGMPAGKEALKLEPKAALEAIAIVKKP